MSKAKEFDWTAAKQRLERARAAIESDSRSEEEVEALYRERAAMLARPIVLEKIDTGEAIMIFLLGAERYAVPLEKVAEVVARPQIAAAPGTSDEISGLVQIRGEIRVAWDIRRVLGLMAGENREGEIMLLLRTGVGEAGILVDEVEDIRAVTDNQRGSPPEGARHAAWMTDDLVIVLDTEALLPKATEENADA